MRRPDQGKLIRECGHIVVDVPSLVGAVPPSPSGACAAQAAHRRQHVLAPPSRVLTECLGRLVRVSE